MKMRFTNYRKALKAEIACADCALSYEDYFSFRKPKAIRCGPQGMNYCPVVSRRKTCDAACRDSSHSSTEGEGTDG